MAKLTKADAVRQLGISRTTLYKLIDQGRVSATPDGLIDTAELVRVMSTMNVRLHLWTLSRWTPMYQGVNAVNVQHRRPVNTRRGRPVNVS